MTDDELFPHYEALWLRLRREHQVIVMYDGAHEPDEGEAAYFIRNENGIDNVCLFRPFYGGEATKPKRERTDGKPVNLLRELCNMAHEAGHCFSLRRGRAEYEVAILRFNDGSLRSKLPEDMKSAVFKEETLAWELGREHVPADLLSEYNEHAENGLAIYREILWPSAA